MACTLFPKDFQVLTDLVLLDIKKSNKNNPFSHNELFKLYADKLSHISNPVRKAEILRHIPEAVSVLLSNPNILKKLVEQSFDFNALYQDVAILTPNLKGDDSDKKLIDAASKLLNTKLGLTKASISKTKTAINKAKTIVAQQQSSNTTSSKSAKPRDFFSSLLMDLSWDNADGTPSRDLFYTNVKATIAEWYARINANSHIFDSSEISYPGLKSGLQLAFVRSNSIPEDQVEPRVLATPELKKAHEQGVVALVVDASGNPVKFDDSGKVSTSGRYAYYLLPNLLDTSQTAKEIRLKEKAQIIKNKTKLILESQNFIDENSNLSSAKREELAKSIAETDYNSEEKALIKIREELSKNPDLKLYSPIIGFNNGIVTVDSEKQTTQSLKELSDFKSVKFTISHKEKGVRFSTPDTHGFSTNLVSPKLSETPFVEGIVNFMLSENIELPNGKERKLTLEEKVKQVLTRISIDPTITDKTAIPFFFDQMSNTIFVQGKAFKFQGVIPVDKAAFENEFRSLLDKSYLSSDAYSLASKTSDTAIYLGEVKEDGSVIAKITSMPIREYYLEYFKSSAYIQNGKIKSSEAGFIFSQPKFPIIETSTEKKEELSSKKAIEDLDVDLDSFDKNSIVKASNGVVTEEQIKAAEKWYKNSPLAKLFPLQLAFHIVNSSNPDAIAQWTRSGITLYKGSDSTDIYHEAWHGFTQGFLSPKEKQKLYTEARKLSGSFVDHKGLTISFKYATELQLEEYLAEDFRKYMLSPQKISEPVKKSIFKKILDFLKFVFGSKSEIKNMIEPQDSPIISEMYERLKMGDFTAYQYNVDNATFNTLNKDNPAIKKESLPFSESDMKDIIASFDGIIAEYAHIKNLNIKDAFENREATTDELKLYTVLTRKPYESLTESQKVFLQKVKFIPSATYNYEKLTSKKFLEEAYTHVKRNIQIQRSLVLAKHDALENTDENKSLIAKYASQIKLYTNMLDHLGDFSNVSINAIKFDSESKTRKFDGSTLIEHHLQHSNIFNKEFLENSIDELEEQEITSKEKGEGSQFEDKSTINPVKRISPTLNLMFKTLIDYDSNGQLKLNRLGFPETVDSNKVFKIVLDTVMDSQNEIEAYTKISKAAIKYPFLQQLKERFGNSPTTTKHPGIQELLSELWKIAQLTEQEVEYSIFEVTKDFEEESVKIIGTYGKASKEFGAMLLQDNSKWLKEASPYKMVSKNNYSYYNIPKILEDFTLNKLDTEFLKALGIYLPETDSVNKLLKNSNNVYKANVSALYQKLKAANNHGILISGPRDLVNNDHYKKIPNGSTATSIDGFLKKQQTVIGTLYELDTRIATFMRSNAEGNSESSVSLPSTMSKIVQGLNNVKGIRAEDLETFPELQHFNIESNIMLRNNGVLSTMFDSSGKKLSSPYKLRLVNYSGGKVIENSSDLGTSNFDADPLSKFMIDLSAFFFKNTFEFMRHADKYKSLGLSLNKPYMDVSELLAIINKGGSLSEAIQTKILPNVLTHFENEMNRINKMIELSKRKDLEYDHDYIKRGSEFVLFGGFITKDLQEQIKKLISGKENITFSELPVLTQEEIKSQLTDVLKYLVEENYNTVNNFKIPDNFNTRLSEKLEKTLNISRADARAIVGRNSIKLKRILHASFYLNNYLFNLDTAPIFYGDMALFKDFYKRNAPVASTGDMFRTTDTFLSFANDVLKQGYAEKLAESSGNVVQPFDRKLKSIIIEDITIESVYYKDLEKRIGKKAAAYSKMDIADAQGYINIDHYRILKKSENDWSPEQEDAYQSLIQGETTALEKMKTFFPVYKLQYYGPVTNDTIVEENLPPLTALHKYSLIPLIPGTGKKTDALLKVMAEQNVTYATFKTGSKVSTITKNGVHNKLFKNDKNEVSDNYTYNFIYLDYLKSQLKMHSKFKGSVSFMTQMRKLIELHAYESGVAKNKNVEKDILAYEKAISNLTNIYKEEILDELQGTLNPDGSYTFNHQKLANYFLVNLGGEITAEELSVLKLTRDKKLRDDLSISVVASEFEKLTLALVNKRIVKQKVKGEGLVLASNLLFDSETNLLGENYITKGNVKKATASQLKALKDKKGSVDLPFYQLGKAMKVKIALHSQNGDFRLLLKLKGLDGNPIETIERLNAAIKDDAWLDKEDNRKAITLIGARIPTQGPNSMEWMEVYEFLPAEYGNILIPPAEIVAKAGSDFDVDKLMVLYPNLSESKLEDGTKGIKLSKMPTEAEMKSAYNMYKSSQEAKNKTAKDYKTWKQSYNKRQGVKAAQNDILFAMAKLLSNELFYDSLITPNSTERLNDNLANKIKNVDESLLEEKRTISAGDSTLTLKNDNPSMNFTYTKSVEIQQQNNIAKDALGIGAVGTTYNSIANRIGLEMEPGITFGFGTESEKFYEFPLLLKHNRSEDGKRISLSKLLDADNTESIVDLYSEAVNGWVDAAKDAWIFYIQGNVQVAPQLLFLLEAGVNIDQAAFFLSIPSVTDYVAYQKEKKRPFNTMFVGTTKDKSPLAKALSKIDENVLKNYGITGTYISERNIYKVLEKIKKDVSFDSDTLNLEEYKKYKTDPKRNQVLQLAALLQYKLIESYASAYQEIKQATNYDTTVVNDVASVTMRNIQTNEARTSQYFPTNTIDKFKNETPIGSFMIPEFQMSIVESIMPLLGNKSLNKFLANYAKANETFVKKYFGSADKFFRTYKQDLLHYLFQNTLVDFDPLKTKEYKTKTIELVDSLPKGVKILGDKLYISITDVSRLLQEGTKEQLATKTNYFGQLNRLEALYKYTHFLVEKELKIDLDTKSGKISEIKTPAQAKEYDREVSKHALDKTYNLYHLFNGPNSIADRYLKLREQYPEIESYSLVESLQVDERLIGNKEFKNLKLIEIEKTAELIDAYRKDFKALTNPSLHNKEIVDFFKKLNMFAPLQSGININSPFSLTRVVDQEKYQYVMRNAVSELNKQLQQLSKFESAEAPFTILEDFTSRFKDLHSENNGVKTRLKDWISTSKSEFVKAHYDIITTDRKGNLVAPLASAPSYTLFELYKNSPDKIFLDVSTDIKLDNVVSFSILEDIKSNKYKTEKEFDTVLETFLKDLETLQTLEDGTVRPIVFPSDNFYTLAGRNLQNKEQLLKLTKALYSKYGFVNKFLVAEKGLITREELQKGFMEKEVFAALMELDSEKSLNKEEPFVVEKNAKKIYSQLGTKTQSENVIIDNVAGRKPAIKPKKEFELWREYYDIINKIKNFNLETKDELLKTYLTSMIQAINARNISLAEDLKKEIEENIETLPDTIDELLDKLSPILKQLGYGRIKEKAVRSIVAYRTKGNNFLEALEKDNAIGNPWSHLGSGQTEVNPFKNSKVQQKVYHVDKRKGLNEETLVDNLTMIFPSGVFFTDNLKYAENYAKAINGEIYEAYINVENPYNTFYKQEIERLGRRPDELEKKYDSVIHKSDNEKDDKYGKVGTEIVIYKPEQIKLIQRGTKNQYGLYKTNTVKEAVEEFIAWMVGEKHTDKLQDYRQAIIDRIPELKGDQILYYKDIKEPSHATALDYLINKRDWTTQQPLTKEVNLETILLNDLFRSKNIRIDKNLKNKDGSKRFASTDGNIITINSVTDYEEFFDYFEGKEEGRTSIQKLQVLKELENKGYTLDKIKSILTTTEVINAFIILHEQSHIDNNDKDVYWKNGKDLLTEDKLQIEVRATLDALKQIEFIIQNDLTNEPAEGNESDNPLEC